MGTGEKATRLFKYGHVSLISAEKGNLHFNVQGSEPDPYDVFRTSSGVWSCNAVKKEVRNGKKRAWGCVMNPSIVCSHVQACELWLKNNKIIEER